MASQNRSYGEEDWIQYLSTNRVIANIHAADPAIPVSVETGHWLLAAEFKRTAQYIFGLQSRPSNRSNQLAVEGNVARSCL